MNRKAILDYFKKEGFEEIDEIEYKDDIVVYNFFYTFDKDEVDAARSYADENSNQEGGEDEWYDEFYLPYLTDIAGDNVKDGLEDLCEEQNLVSEFVAFEMDKDSSDQIEFIIVLADEGKEFDIDEILDELEM